MSSFTVLHAAKHDNALTREFSFMVSFTKGSAKRVLHALRAGSRSSLRPGVMCFTQLHGASRYRQFTFLRFPKGTVSVSPKQQAVVR